MSILPLIRFWVICITTVAGLANPLTAAFFGDPPNAHYPWAVHDHYRPQPPRVEPATVPGGAPSDAVVLFDGTEASLENWYHVSPEDQRVGDWIVKEGALQCVPGAGYIASKEEFGDCQLHVEWLAPSEIKGNGQERGNSGVFLMGMVEVQVLDNYNNPTYADGTAGAVYGVMPPAANSLRGPGEWQSYDIIFRRPIVRDGVVIDEGSLTVMVNGVVVQDSTPLEGGGGWKKRRSLDRVFPEQGSLRLQDHGNPVRYRNIWYRPLRPRPADGGTDGRLSPEATLVKRAEIAAGLREDAAEQHGINKMILLLDSLVYEWSETDFAVADRWIRDYLGQFASFNTEQINAQERNILLLDRALSYLSFHRLIPADYSVLSRVDVIAVEYGWKIKPVSKVD
jgi:hypothetical protein